jgi:peroxiredoxin Q/BCP
MGKKYMGIERSTFLIKDGIVKKVWRKVSVANHIQELLQNI